MFFRSSGVIKGDSCNAACRRRSQYSKEHCLGFLLQTSFPSLHCSTCTLFSFILPAFFIHTLFKIITIDDLKFIQGATLLSIQRMHWKWLWKLIWFLLFLPLLNCFYFNFLWVQWRSVQSCSAECSLPSSCRCTTGSELLECGMTWLVAKTVRVGT